MAPLLRALLLLAVSASAETPAAKQRLDGAAAISQAGAVAPTDLQARDAAGAAFEGGAPGGDAVGADDRTVKKGIPLKPALSVAHAGKDAPPPPAEEKPRAGKLSSGLMLGGAALLGGLQGWFAAGLVGAAAGAVLGLGAAWLFHKGDYGGAFGVTAGAIIGTALAGPLGGVVGAVVGGVVGHFLGKLFL